MQTVLKLKHWQIFIFLSLATFLLNFTIIGDPFLTQVLNLSGILLYSFWQIGLGLELTEYLPKKVDLSKAVFTFNAFGIIISLAILILIFDGYFSSSGMLGFFWVIYVMYALLHLFLFPAKVLRSIEMKKKAGFADYIGYSLLMLIWPIGIWWLQPKLNKVLHESEIAEAEAEKMITD